MKWWWLSFVDPRRPAGTRFLGVAIIEGVDLLDAARAAFTAGCNPGGEVAGLPFPHEEMIEAVPPDLRRRLLTQAEAEKVDALVGQALDKKEK